MSKKKQAKLWSEHPSTALAVGEGFRLADVDPASTPGFDGDRDDAEALLAAGVEELSELQEKLFAASRAGGGGAPRTPGRGAALASRAEPEMAPPPSSSVLLVLQAMDSAGKGGIVRHVVGAVDPQGVRIMSFKKPTPEELSHDFLWRIRNALPEPGFIGVFDRSHYEDVLIGRVRSLAPAEEIERRYDAIVDFERELADAGCRLIKVMLHLSPEEQKARLGERLERADKHWKYSPGDLDERALWPQYQEAYQIALERTSTETAPWHVVPADSKWFARLAVHELLLAELRGLDLGWPEATFDVEAEKARLAASEV